MHILIGIPVSEHVHADFSLGCLQQIIEHTRRALPDVRITVCYQRGVRTDLNRNKILQAALGDSSVEYILWLDSDMLYPADIIERYLEVRELNSVLDVIGCLYFQRISPFEPVAYEQFEGVTGPYRTIFPPRIEAGKVYEVAAVGYGGMFVRRSVYDRLGAKKWTHYGPNYHLPETAPDQLTHDLQFCSDVKAAGLSVKLHGGVRPAHLSTQPITIADWRRVALEKFELRKAPPAVHVLMPATDRAAAERAAAVMRVRAGVPCEVHILLDEARAGFVKTINAAALQLQPELLVYSAQDVLVGEDWLKEAFVTMIHYNAGLVGFHDGKWRGSLASFGLVNYAWAKTVYGGALFFPGYHSHYGDIELTQVAKQQGKYAFAERAVMLEVDFDKALGRGAGVKKEDKDLFSLRKKAGFDGKVLAANLLAEYS